MGGLGGHLNHLYDNPSLTFGEIKDIFSKASGGQLFVMEKTDGINIYLSYSVKMKEPRAARNISNIKTGGLGSEELARKFADRGSLTDAFKEAFDSWAAIINSLDTESQIEIFGQDAEIYYSAEIMGSQSQNVVNYDQKTLVLHSTGGGAFDKTTGKIIDVDISQNRKLLKGLVDKIQKNDGAYKVMFQAISQIKKIENDVPLNTALVQLNRLMSQTKINDSNTIEEFCVKSGLKTKEAIFPLENIIHNFTVEILKGLESIYILDNKKEISRIRQEVGEAISIIQSSGNEEANEILQQQLIKLKNVDNITTSIEGFVFVYNGNTYKFTGNFAPINQILGLFKFGRGSKIPPIKKVIKESQSNKVIAFFAGAFKPPHAEHFLAANDVAKDPNVNEVIILISNNKDRVITPTQSLRIWGIYTSATPKIKAKISQHSSPITEIFNLLPHFEPGDTIVFILGEKEKKESSLRFKNLIGYINKEKPGINVKFHYNTHNNITGTQARVLLSQKNKEGFYQLLPGHLSPQDKQQVWEILTSMSNQIKEISAMGNGDITGAPTPSKDIPNKTGYPYDREKLYQEVKLREVIRKMIKESYANRLFSYQEEFLQETLLRSKIKHLLLQEKKSKSPEVVHPSTGINVLEDLLKQIIPTIEQDYKVLTTSDEQRESFKNHILNAINKTITTLDINQGAGDGEGAGDLAESLIPEIDVAVGKEVDGKYIDIDKKPGDEDEKDTFTIDGQDTTGRNMAQQTYDKIEKNIIDSYSMLDDPEDQKVFYDYLMTNVRLYVDKWESELSSQVQEPVVNAEPENDGGDDIGNDSGGDLDSLLQ